MNTITFQNEAFYRDNSQLSKFERGQIPGIKIDSSSQSGLLVKTSDNTNTDYICRSSSVDSDCKNSFKALNSGQNLRIMIKINPVLAVPDTYYKYNLWFNIMFTDPTQQSFNITVKTYQNDLLGTSTIQIPSQTSNNFKPYDDRRHNLYPLF